jgi:sulfocyanin
MGGLLGMAANATIGARGGQGRAARARRRACAVHAREAAGGSDAPARAHLSPEIAMTRSSLAAPTASAAVLAAVLAAFATACAKESARNTAADTGAQTASSTATTAAALDTGTAQARAAAGPNAQTASLPAAEQTNPTTTVAAATTQGRQPSRTPSAERTTTTSAGGAVAARGAASATGKTTQGTNVATRAQTAAAPGAQRGSPSAGATSAQGGGAAGGGAAGGAPGATAAEVKVNPFMQYDAAAKTVSLNVYAAYNNQQGGFNFNGGSNGSHTITVPVGWTVRMHVVNKDAIPHSAIVINDQHPLPQAPSEAAIPRAYTAHLNDGLPPVNGSDDVVFKASTAGHYLLDCGVPGHGQSGMWIHFNVAADAQAPTYQM